MRQDDLPTVKRISDIVHADLTESDAVFARRLEQFPQGCFMTEDGYAVAHPAMLGTPPELDELDFGWPQDADALHIHDVALLEHRRGGGLGKAVVALLLSVGRTLGFRHSTLVAVSGKSSYWQSHGYHQHHAARPEVIKAYGTGATYMWRRLAE